MNRALAPAFLGSLGSRRLTTLLSMLAIALGIALGVAVQVIHDAALDEFDHGMRTLSGEADLQIVGPRGGFADALFEIVVLRPEVAAASPLLETEARLFGEARMLRVIGVDIFRLAEVQPVLFPQPAAGEDRFAALRDDAIFLSPGAMQALGLKAGDTLRLQSGLEPLPLRVAGGVPGMAGQQVAVMDIAAAQHRFGRAGMISRIDLRLREGLDLTAGREALGPLLPAGVQVLAPERARQQAAGLSRAYRVNLTMLAVIALVTGGFLVFSTQALSVVRRRTEFAFLRAIGLARQELMRWLLAEGALVGAIGAAAGVALGYGLAAAALTLLGGDLGAGYFAGITPRLAFEPIVVAVFLALGTVAGVVGAWLPAREAATVSPAMALKSGGDAAALGGGRRHPGWALGAALLAGAACLVPPWAGIPVGGYVAVALLLAAGVFALPMLAARLSRVLAPLRMVPVTLARSRLAAVPGHVVVAGAGVLASAALAVAMAIMVASFRHSVDDWLAQILPAELYARGARAGSSGYFDPAAQALIAGTPGVAKVDFIRHDTVLLAPDRPAVVLIARPLTADGRELPLVGERVATDRPVWISEAVADLYGYGAGDTIGLPLAGELREFTVAGVWRDYARQSGAIMIPLERYRTLSGDRLANDAALHLLPGETPAAVAARLRERFGGEALELAQAGEIRAISLRIFDRTFAVTYLLEAVAVVIGLFGVAASFAALAAARRREFGMLRHIGLTRRQVGLMLATEGALTAAAGALGGLVVGGAISLVLVEVVNRQSFHWSMDFRVPFGILAAFCVTLVLLAALAAVLAGRQAMRQEAVMAVKEDW
ncbi:MAG: FtsX-like permease family protein [Rhodocyclaceae bacterium]|nr:FtsX-like permease family protein [Rhodocyclaceae bacterium]MCP5295820.1 FtsX-like permease family protein [Zoogloeaceae bacterium]MCW5615489.1 FtsX-like permease family protein [Rhodocyclaceae bacterium]